MSRKTRGTIILVCGMICLVGAGIMLAVRLLNGTGMEISEISELVLSFVLGIYFCQLGVKKRKADK